MDLVHEVLSDAGADEDALRKAALRLSLTLAADPATPPREKASMLTAAAAYLQNKEATSGGFDELVNLLKAP